MARKEATPYKPPLFFLAHDPDSMADGATSASEINDEVPLEGTFEQTGERSARPPYPWHCCPCVKRRELGGSKQVRCGRLFL